MTEREHQALILREKRVRLLRFVLALLLPLGAVILQAALFAFLQPYVWFLFYSAVFASSWVGGRRAGLLATVLTTVLVLWFFVPPVYSLVKDPRQYVPAGVFFIMGCIFAVFHDLLRKANEHAAAALAAAERADESSRTAELRASEAKFSGVISIAGDAIISVDEDQRITIYNERAQQIFGWAPEQVLGKPLSLLIPERFREGHRQHIRKFAAEPARTRKLGELRGIFGLRKDGEEFPAEATVSKLELEGVWLFTVVLRDITERVRIEKEQELLAEFAAAVATNLDFEETMARIAQLVIRDLAEFCAVDLVEDEGSARRLLLVHSDPAKAEVCRRLARISPGRTSLVKEVMATTRPVVVSRMTREFQESIAQSPEHLQALLELDSKSGVLVPMIARGRVLGTLSIGTRQHSPRDLAFFQDLANRAALALDNARLYETSQKAVQARDNVLGIVAHDLRNPLNILLMQASVLRSRAPGSDGKSRDPIDVIERSAARMHHLIQDLLDVTRMEAHGFSVEQARVSARQLVSDSLDGQKQLAASAALELRFDVPADLPEVWADRDRLLQVFENLIGNAIKFTGSGGRVTVGAVPHEGGVQFWVHDTGAGISGEDLPHVFDRFWQARKANRRGAGLGLPIARGIVEAHGGRIWVESTSGQGSTFFFAIPAAPRAEETRSL